MKCIYSAIYGQKDNPKQLIQNECDALLFSNDKMQAPGWKQITFNPNLKDSKLNAKFLKLQPHRVSQLQNYNIRIWLDGSIKVTNNKFFEFLINSLGDNDIAFAKHPLRNCIYEEYDACIKAGRLKTDEEKEIALKQLIKYKKEKLYPESGLFAGGVIVSRKCLRVNNLFDHWWREVLNGSHRDQLSLPYILQKLKIEPAIIPLNVDKNRYFKIVKHLR